MVDSYYSTYPLEYYEEGIVYSFYVKKSVFYQNSLSGIAFASEQQIKKYGKFIDAMEDDNAQYFPEGAYRYLYRLYGVVVGKEIADKNKNAKIIVMFKVDRGQYVIKKYVVNFHKGVACDGLEVLAPKVKYPFFDGEVADKAFSGGSGITDAAELKKTRKSGITDIGNDTSDKKVSGITDSTTDKVNKVSGITDAFDSDDEKE